MALVLLGPNKVRFSSLGVNGLVAFRVLAMPLASCTNLKLLFLASCSFSLASLIIWDEVATPTGVS